jgi:hypothetical protein
MFDTLHPMQSLQQPVSPLPERRSGALSLTELSSRLKPVTRADEQVLPVSAELASLFPWGGLRRGSILDIDSRSVCWLTIAEVVREGSWVGLVGVPDAGWASLAEHGVPSERVVVIDTPPIDVAATVIAALVDALDVVIVGSGVTIGASDLRKLSSRVRERGGVLVGLGGRWSEGVDVRLRVRSSRWVGLGQGVGLLEGREVQIEAEGRGAAARVRSVTIWAQGAADGRWEGREGRWEGKVVAEMQGEQPVVQPLVQQAARHSEVA